MSTGRNRASRSIGNKLNQVDAKAEKAAAAPKALPKGSVTDIALAENSVTDKQIAPNSVGPEALLNGAVQTQNLGTVNRINSDSQLLFNTQSGLAVGGSGYTLPIAPSGPDQDYGLNHNSGKFFPMSIDSSGNIVADGVTTNVLLGVVSRYYTQGAVPFYFYSGGGDRTAMGKPDGYAGWLAGYTPRPSDSVILVRDLGTYQTGATTRLNNDEGWVIVGTFNNGANTNTVPPLYPIPLAPGVSGTARYSPNYADRSMTRTSGGIVSLSGLVVPPPEGLAPGAALYQLPQMFSPDYRMDFPARAANGTAIGQGSEGATRISVFPDGRVTVPQGLTANNSTGWISLDNIFYPAAGVASWTPAGVYYAVDGVFNIGPNFVDAEDIDSGPVEYWIDGWNTVWWHGQISPKPGYTPTNNAPMVVSGGSSNLPSYSLREHYATICTDNTQGGASSSGVNLIEWQSPSTPSASVAVALAPITLGPLGGRVPLTLTSSWVNYGGAYSTASWSRRSDGLARYNGVIKSGTLNASAYTSGNVTPGYSASRTIRVAASNGQATGRLDYIGDGRVWPQAGSNAWFSLDGQMAIATATS